MKNENYNIDHYLNKIERVNTPPFLLTLIEARLNSSDTILPTPWSFAYLTMAMVIVLLNAFVLVNYSGNNQLNNGSIVELSSSLNMNISNQLYNEQD